MRGRLLSTTNVLGFVSITLIVIGFIFLQEQVMLFRTQPQWSELNATERDLAAASGEFLAAWDFFVAGFVFTLIGLAFSVGLLFSRRPGIGAIGIMLALLAMIVTWLRS
jgi:hypothetical protein